VEIQRGDRGGVKLVVDDIKAHSFLGVRLFWFTRKANTQATAEIRSNTHPLD
jgi:hypothetical protein